MIRGRFFRTGDDIAPIFALREQVFVQELGHAASSVQDAADDMAIFALVYDEQDVPGGTGRLALDDDRIMIGRVCVRAEARGQGLGDLVMRMLLHRVIEMNAPGVYVKALPAAAAFYGRYGLRAVGEPFDEEGAMRQLMYAAADQIDIEGSCQKREGPCANCDKDCAGDKGCACDINT